MPVGIEVYGDNGQFQFGGQHRGMKVLKRLLLQPTRIITSDTGNSIQPDYYLANHWWSTEDIFSPDALIAVRPLAKGERFYAHFYRGARSWFNTPSWEQNATFSIFVSRPCEVFIYDYPKEPPNSMAGLVVYDDQGRPTFSSDGIHMRIAAHHAGQLPVVGAGNVFPSYGPATISLPPGDYMVCPLVKPYQIFCSDEYDVGAITFYDFNERNPWYVVGNDYVTVEPRTGFHHGLSSLAYSDVDFPFFSHLVLHANWEQSYPLSP